MANSLINTFYRSDLSAQKDDSRSATDPGRAMITLTDQTLIVHSLLSCWMDVARSGGKCAQKPQKEGESRANGNRVTRLDCAENGGKLINSLLDSLIRLC